MQPLAHGSSRIFRSTISTRGDAAAKFREASCTDETTAYYRRAGRFVRSVLQVPYERYEKVLEDPDELAFRKGNGVKKESLFFVLKSPLRLVE